VVNFTEYQDVINKILKQKPTKALTILLDMNDVEKAASKVSILETAAYMCIDFIFQQKYVSCDSEDESNDDGEGTDIS
jgi:hypothetical protein